MSTPTLAPLGLLVLLAAPLGAQTDPASSPSERPAPRAVLAGLDVASGTVQELALPDDAGRAFTLDLRLEGRAHRLRLWPYEVRSEDFRLWVADERGVHEVPAPAPVTMRGVVEGEPESAVAASLVDGSLHATVRIRSGDGLWGVQPASEVDPSAPASTHVVYRSEDAVALDVRCGTPDPVGPLAPAPPGATGTSGTTALSAGIVMTAELGCDADFEFYQQNGSSVTATQNDITTIVNAVNAIYESQLQINHLITGIVVRTSQPDPYSTNDPGGLLGQLMGEWNLNQLGIHRDVAHLFTGHNLSGSVIGVAYLGVLCNVSSAYGLSQSRYTSNMTNRTALTAHELGHNWSSPHCNGQTDCRIMCSSLGGCGTPTSFGTQAQTRISNHRDANLACLTASLPPVLTAIAPGAVQAFEDPTVLTLTGDHFETATRVLYGSQELLPFAGGFTIENDTTITFEAPTAEALGPLPVAVLNTGGSSASVLVDVQPTSPPRLLGPSVWGGLFPLTLHFGGDPGDVWFLFASIDDPTTFPFQGFDVLSSSFFVGLVGLLGPVGLGSATTVVPPGTLVGRTVYAHVLLLDDVAGGFHGATNVLAIDFVL